MKTASGARCIGACSYKNNSISPDCHGGLDSQSMPSGASWPRDLQSLSRSQLLALQTALNAHGFDSGTPDGTMGPAAQRGIRLYQRSLGLRADSYPTGDLLQRLESRDGTAP